LVPLLPDSTHDGKDTSYGASPSDTFLEHAKDPCPPDPEGAHGGPGGNAQDKSNQHRNHASGYSALIKELFEGLGEALVVLAVLLGPFLFIVWTKARRRQRRRSAERPSDRVAGGW